MCVKKAAKRREQNDEEIEKEKGKHAHSIEFFTIFQCTEQYR